MPGRRFVSFQWFARMMNSRVCVSTGGHVMRARASFNEHLLALSKDDSLHLPIQSLLHLTISGKQATSNTASSLTIVTRVKVLPEGWELHELRFA